MRKLVSIISVVTLALTGTAISISAADAATPKTPTGIAISTDHTGVKPKAVKLTRSGSWKVNNISWHSWGKKEAWGYGTLAITDKCDTECANNLPSSPAKVVIIADTVKSNKFSHVTINTAVASIH